ncbi:MAG: NAD kinase [Propionicimonas sp.]
MDQAARRVTVTVHPGRPAALAAAAQFIAGMHAHGIEILVAASDVDRVASQVPAGAVRTLPESADASGSELVVVFGGDGNILRAAEWALPREVPVLGVNLGHVGFLAELESSEVVNLVQRVVDRDYQVEERMTIDTVVRDAVGEVVWESFAINECSVEKLARERMLEVLVRVDDRPLSRWATDGVLVSTPTGSTAYAFSAHGPVIWPDLSALLLVPLSAHALFNRPLVLSDRSVVSIEVLPATPSGVIWCDGRRSWEVTAGSVIEARAGAHRLRLARTSEQPFVNRLVRKFGLPVDGWRGAAEREQAHAR